MNPITIIARKVRDILGLPSMQEIFPGVYAGDFGDARRVAALENHGIKYVLNVAAEITDPNLYRHYGIEQVKFGLVDWDNPANEAKLVAALDTMDRWYGRNSGNILVHCEGGRNRTLYVLARWWARRTGRNWREVADEIIDKRPEASLHPWMLRQGPK